MDPRVVGAVLDRIGARWRMAEDVEITLEANPTSVEAAAACWVPGGGGEPRLPWGAGADDEDLRRLGRLHSVAEALAAHEMARRIFERVSFDLIYARQDQSVADWEAELANRAGAWTDHLSLYQLTIEDPARRSETGIGAGDCPGFRPRTGRPISLT